MVALSEKKIVIVVLSSQYCVIVEAAKIRVLLQLITHGASEASGVCNFWHLGAKILYTVEPKTATSP